MSITADNLGITINRRNTALATTEWPNEQIRLCEQREDTTVEDLLEAVKLAYRKHHLGDPSIGWDELSDKLLNVLCETMGDRAFIKWVEEVTDYP